jgi:micrococcal nuclease
MTTSTPLTRSWPLWVLVLCAAVALLLGGAGCARLPAGGTTRPGIAADHLPSEATVTAEVDGDTVRVDGVRARLIGIDTPETVKPDTPVQCFGEASSAHTKSLLPVGTRVRVVYDVERLDHYGRALVYLYRLPDGLFVNADLVRGGYARAEPIPPDTSMAGLFRTLESQARAAGRGRWSACP